MREATKADLPRGREAQCPICWRIFSSDRVCESHKPYARPTTPDCKNPPLCGLMEQERRGLVVWKQDRPHGRFGL